MGANLSILTKVAISKLTDSKPRAWDTNARQLFDSTAKNSHPDAGADMLEAAWKNGLAHMRDHYRDEWDTYAKHTKNPTGVTAVSWDDVKLIKGQADGDTFELHFEVEGVPCVIECTDLQLLDPAFVLRKLVLYTYKDISCPYLGRKQLEAWRRNVVLPWLKSAFIKHVDRETTASAIEGLIREYCSDTTEADTGAEAWLQQKRPVLEKEIVYVPFSGLQEFIARRLGNDPSKKAIKNTLARLNFSLVKKGKMRLRFHAIHTNKLYEYDENTDPGETGGGEVDADRDRGPDDLNPRRDGFFDVVREEECGGLATEDGQRPATPQAPGTAPDMPDDPLAAL